MSSARSRTAFWAPMVAMAAVAMAVAVLLGAMVAEAAPPSAALVEAGRRIYREGVGSEGAPVRGVVEGDIAVTGTQLSCAECHRRSAMGSREGNRIVPAVAWPILGARDNHRQRPAYTEATLARALRTGRAAAGRPLDPLMPRYQLSAADEEGVIAYLRSTDNTSGLVASGQSRPAAGAPGVDKRRIRFATVITPEADTAEALAMVKTLEAFLKVKNSQTRGEERRKRAAPFPERIHLAGWRHWTLSVWYLKGPPETWRAQLEARQKAGPVFALIAGAGGGGTWQPVHDFCNAEHIPCVGASVQRVPVDPSNEYVLYGLST